MIHLLMAHPGRHFDPATLSALPPFFCRVLRGPWRKQATATPPGDRYACCTHCVPVIPGDHPEDEDQHPEPCNFGCNDPVLGDKTIAEVREEYGRGEHPYPPVPVFTRTAPTFTPSELLSTGELRVLDERVDKLMAAEADRLAYIRPYVAETKLATPELLERVKNGLLNLDAPAPEFGQAPQLEVEPELAKRVIA